MPKNKESHQCRDRTVVLANGFGEAIEDAIQEVVLGGHSEDFSGGYSGGYIREPEAILRRQLGRQYAGGNSRGNSGSNIREAL